MNNERRTQNTELKVSSSPATSTFSNFYQKLIFFFALTLLSISVKAQASSYTQLFTMDASTEECDCYANILVEFSACLCDPLNPLICQNQVTQSTTFNRTGSGDINQNIVFNNVPAGYVINMDCSWLTITILGSNGLPCSSPVSITNLNSNSGGNFLFPLPPTPDCCATTVGCGRLSFNIDPTTKKIRFIN